jgi:hypothetical protein
MTSTGDEPSANAKFRDCHAIEIGTVLLGEYTVRKLRKSITFLILLAFQDLTTAALAFQLAEEQSLGTVLHW